jgi:hypothetical protein
MPVYPPSRRTGLARRPSRQLPVGPLSASLTARPAGDRGQALPFAPGSAGSPPTPESGAAVCRTRCATRIRSSSPVRALRTTSSSASSATPTAAPRRSTCSADDVGQRGAATLTATQQAGRPGAPASPCETRHHGARRTDHRRSSTAAVSPAGRDSGLAHVSGSSWVGTPTITERLRAHRERAPAWVISARQPAAAPPSASASARCRLRSSLVASPCGGARANAAVRGDADHPPDGHDGERPPERMAVEVGDVAHQIDSARVGR